MFRQKEILKLNGPHHIMFKACLVTCGFIQTHGIDYEDTFASVVKFSTLSILLAVDALEALRLQQMNLQTAFLKGDMTKCTIL